MLKTFYKCKVYLHEKLNTSKGIIRNREFYLATPDELKKALGKQGMMDY